MSQEGLPFSPEVTKMKNDSLGVTFRETMSGGFSLGETDPQAGKEKGEADNTILSMHATVNIRNLRQFISDPDHTGEIVGRIDFAPFGSDLPAKSGVFNLFLPTDRPGLKLMVYELAFDHEGQEYYLAGRKEVHDDPGFDVWSDTTTLLTVLHKGGDKTGPIVGAGVLTLGVADLARLASTIRVTGAGSASEHAVALADFGAFFMGELWDTHLRKLVFPSWWRRLLRILGLSRPA